MDGKDRTDRRIRPGPVRLAGGAALLAALALGLCAALLGPTRALREVPYSTSVYDRSGDLLRLTLAADEKYRLKAEARELPERFTEALLLKEDRAFFLHPGIDPPALARAFWHSFVLKDYRSGGSTITMQLARLLYRLDTRDLRGKALQIVRALALDLAYPKGRLLEAYCSLVPCGGNVEGFPAASLLYLGKPLKDLSLSEILLLCSLPQQPSRRDSPAALQARNALYLQWLRRHPEDRALAVQFRLPQELRLQAPFAAPHAVTSLLARYPGRGRIDSTLDSRLQRTVERVLSGCLDKMAHLGITNASALLVRSQGMEVLAEVGSADFFDEAIAGQVNGTEAKRSPGSALKPFLYALAMEQSLIHPLTMLKDAPIHFSGYNPDNFDDDFVGPIRARDALILSRNVPAVFLSQQVKDPDLYDFLQQAGVRGLRGRQTYGISLVLGTAEVSMKELAELYGILANLGSFAPLSDTLGGRPAGPSQPRILLSPQAAYLTRDILAHKPRPDPGYAGDPVAWKTGTSIGFRDAWSIGIFDSFILCVWVGNFDGSGNPQFIGLRSAAPLMFEIIDAVRSGGLGREYRGDFHPRPPADIIPAKVCAVSGKIPNPFCPVTALTLFIPGKSPIDVCDVHQQIHIDARTGLRRSRPVDGATRTEVYEVWSSDLLALFEKAGLPRRLPPPYAPGEQIDDRSESGRAPQIVSPLPGGEYAVPVTEAAREEIPLIAVVPADAATLYWFLDESYLGQSARGKAFFWKPHPGSFVLRATDEHGRSASCRFTIALRP
jgi:penicillin-binding protein 1C